MLETEIASSKLKKNCTETKIPIFALLINSVHKTSINKQVQTPQKKKSYAVVAKPFYKKTSNIKAVIGVTIYIK